MEWARKFGGVRLESLAQCFPKLYDIGLCVKMVLYQIGFEDSRFIQAFFFTL